VPFGEIAAARDWLKLEYPVGKPEREHPQRPVTGFACARSEVSGRRLWGLFAERFGTPERFFAEHIVMNYCPLAFLESTGRNRTPDKLPASEKAALFAACDRHLRAVVAALQPEWLIGIGDFALKRAEQVFPTGPRHPEPWTLGEPANFPSPALKGTLSPSEGERDGVRGRASVPQRNPTHPDGAGDMRPWRIARILHPSPASPAANRNWKSLVTHQLEELGVWR
jgi:single-strand selective monofunctional uracil DNA glycosylase